MNMAEQLTTHRLLTAIARFRKAHEPMRFKLADMDRVQEERATERDKASLALDAAMTDLQTIADGSQD